MATGSVTSATLHATPFTGSGHPITWAGDYNGQRYEDKGEIVAFEPERRLEVTRFSPLSGAADVPENYHRLVYTLTSTVDGGTHVRLEQDNNGNAAEAERASANWARMLQGLKTHVENS